MSERSQIEASRLARGLGAALDRVIRGETIDVLRYGRVVAVLAPPPRERREPRAVRPDKLGAIEVGPPHPDSGVKPFLKPALEATTRQQRIDDILRGSRKGDR